ncbi:septum formation protein [Caldalkalibacillus uzonensis]|uniref:dTTP/UTP pyrophosphatase n=1 Tax=Caldalkalibacillus uzonensis TaxID=353224 RepID=A0ABU0CST9_9BACI|nr:Maf family protein [Caldalkalibacillus uzonensis]MDQ0339490.1 septum formation protein [Caldalkalibacillus uzonensis]
MTVKTIPPIILASSSPRRKELLNSLGLAYHIHPSQAEETFDPRNSPEMVVQKLAHQKASDVARHYEQGLVIGADTIVVLNGEVLGKPKDESEAFQMLSRLQGETHTVYSGLAVIDADSGKECVGCQGTKVLMRPMGADEIKAYIATGEPMDKAGSYAIQGLGATLVDKIEGDYFTVVGMPVALLARFLHQFGINVLTVARQS